MACSVVFTGQYTPTGQDIKLRGKIEIDGYEKSYFKQVAWIFKASKYTKEICSPVMARVMSCVQLI